MKFSIKAIVSSLLIGVTFVDIFIITLLVINQTSDTLREQINSYYDVSIARVEDNMVSIFDSWDSALLNKAKSELLINSLIDELGREQYLPSIIEELSKANFGTSFHIAFLDFQLDPIKTSSDWLDNGIGLLDQKRIAEIVIENGNLYHDFRLFQGSIHYLLGVPVFYEGSAEGVLFAAFNWIPIWQNIIKNQKDISLKLVYNGNVIAEHGKFDISGLEKKISLPHWQALNLQSLIPEEKIRGPVYKLASKILLGSFILMFVMVSINVLFVARKIANPLIRLRNAVNQVEKGQWERVQLSKGSTEILDLAEAFNQMTHRLEQTQKKLELEKKKQLQQAYESGIAENAISVLHNIGNAITPAVVNLKKLQNSREKSRLLSYLAKLSKSLMEQHQTGNLDTYLRDNPKGKQMLPFLEKLLEEMEVNREQGNERLDGIEKQLKHVSKIILLQQKYANFKAIEEEFELSSIINDSLSMMESSFKKRNIKITQNIEADSILTMDKNKLIQVLVNFLKNSAESIDSRLKSEPDMIPEIHIETNTEDREWIQVQIQDTGSGIDPETLDQVFKFGYSTKERGSGFGLHDCANFIKALGGNIQLTSPGIGQGATLLFTLPLA